MDKHFLCPKCRHRIPIRPELIGQYVLCPSCLYQVYVTDLTKNEVAEKTSAPEPPDLSQPPVVSARRGPAETGKQALPLGILVSIPLGLLLVVLIAVVVMRGKPAGEGGELAGTSATPPPPPSSASETTTEEPATAPAAIGGYANAPPPSAVPPVAGPPSGYANAPKADGPRPGAPSGVVDPSRPWLSAAPGGSGSAKGGYPQPVSAPTSTEIWPLPDDASWGQVLASISDEPTPWKIGVRSAEADPVTVAPFRAGFPGATKGPPIVLEPDADQESWVLKDVSGAEAAAGNEVLARLKRTGADLVFAWAASPKNPYVRRQVANCLLEVSDGKLKRIGQLRQPVRVQPIELDFTLEKQQIETQVDDVPRLDGVRMEVVGWDGFSSEPRIRGTKTAMAVSPAAPISPLAATAAVSPGPPAVVLEFTEIPGLEIRVRFVNPQPRGKLAIVVDPVFRESTPPKEHDLRTPRLLDRLEAEAEKPLANAKRELPSAELKAKRAREEEREWKTKEPPANNPRLPKWQYRHRDLTQSATRFESELNALTKQIETYQAKADAVAKLREFLKSSQKQAKIQYMVYSECGEPDLLLIDGRASE
jgi:hypothetical protein